jgi:hypothetical protein
VNLRVGHDAVAKGRLFRSMESRNESPVVQPMKWELLFWLLHSITNALCRFMVVLDKMPAAFVYTQDGSIMLL